MNKLKYHGIRGILHQWFESYLKNRFQHVQFNDQISDLSKITTGARQGSTLGSLLFIIHMNDTHKVSGKFSLSYMLTNLIKPSLTSCIHTDKNMAQLFSIIYKELCEITDWLVLNKLLLKVKKKKIT